MPINLPDTWGIKKNWSTPLSPKEKVKQKIIEMVESKDFIEAFDKEIQYELDSGKYNITDESSDDYRLPKKILYDSLKSLANQYRPLSHWKF